MKPIKVFLDSSVIIAGLASRSGSSHKVLLLAELEIIIPYISEQVVTEVFRNIQLKLPECTEAFFTLFNRLPFIISDPAADDLRLANSLINEKDAPVMAAAITAGADWLLSLDKHFLKDWKGEVGFLAASPAEFLQKFTTPISKTHF